MADFKLAHKRTARFEGGYANNKLDSGGETWKGIARNYWPKWVGWKIVDRVKATKTKSLDAILFADPELNNLVDQFYEANFWDTVNLDQIKSQEVANSLFDIAVNMGVGRAAKFLQQACGVLVDGKIGPKTIVAANGVKPEILYNSINELRRKKYEEFIIANPSQEVFRKSWMSRIKPFEKALV